jgi:hypothetical protein
MSTNGLKEFIGVYVVAGQVRRITFEAPSLEDAHQQATKWGVGVAGESLPAAVVSQVPTSLPETFNLKEAQRLLGVSRSTVYQLLKDGFLDRLPGIRRTLITRRSLERFASGRS